MNIKTFYCQKWHLHILTIFPLVAFAILGNFGGLYLPKMEIFVDPKNCQIKF